MDLEDDANLVEEVHLEDDDTLNNMMMHDDLEACGDISYSLGYDQTLYLIITCWSTPLSVVQCLMDIKHFISDDIVEDRPHLKY